jgi:outer membrane protein OmpA-like peptidoglycan-associated protein
VLTTTSRLRRVTALAAALTVAAGSSTACSSWSPPRDAGALAIVVGVRNNMPMPTLLSEAQEILHTAVLSKDRLFVIGVSGDPKTLLDEQITSECDGAQACDGFAADYEAGLGERLSQPDARANSGEADTLAAILLAARSLAKVDTHGPRQMVVVDSGLQTSGDLLLQAPGAMGAEPAAVVRQLGGEDGKLKDLANISVLYSGLGAVHAPQEPLSSEQRQRLWTLWKTILETGGASATLDEAALPDEPPLPDLPAVTAVQLDDQKPRTDPLGCTTVRADQVGFVADQAVFVDPGKAREVLKPIADGLVQAQRAATVIGTTALPEDPPYPLSAARAQLVVEELSALGVPPTLLTSGGVGTNFDSWVDPAQPDGSVNETLAVQNRLVFITPVGAKCQ